MYTCRKCQTSDKLDVVITTQARLNQSENGEEFETDIDQASCRDHEWDSNSTIFCNECGHSGPASKFLVEHPATGEISAEN